MSQELLVTLKEREQSRCAVALPPHTMKFLEGVICPSVLIAFAASNPISSSTRNNLEAHQVTPLLHYSAIIALVTVIRGYLVVSQVWSPFSLVFA